MKARAKRAVSLSSARAAAWRDERLTACWRARAPLTTSRAFGQPNVRPDARRRARPDVSPDPNQKLFHKTLIMESTVT